MNANEARRLLSLAAEDAEPADLAPAVLSKLTIDDVPEGASFKIGTPKDGILHLDWSGTFHRQGNVLFAEADHTWTRKYWYAPLGLEQYLDLVRRAVETRHRVRVMLSLPTMMMMAPTSRCDSKSTRRKRIWREHTTLSGRSKQKFWKLLIKPLTKSGSELQRLRHGSQDGVRRPSIGLSMRSRLPFRLTTKGGRLKNYAAGYSPPCPASQ